MAQRYQTGKRRDLVDSDKQLFVEVVEKYLNIIECKKTDSTTCRLKQKTWGAIVNEFQRACPNANNFETQQAQNLWKNLKARAKTDCAQYRLAMNQTGGGPPPPPIKDISMRISGKI